MNIIEIKNYLYNLGGASKGLDNFREFLSLYDNPHLKYKTIQVLGTNGKGSTTAMIEKLLENKYNVATFTSPAIIDVFDRIQINRLDISEDDFVEIANLIYDDAIKYSLGFFEVLCAIAFIYFSRNNIDYAIIEAGLGGMCDCTSVIKSEVKLLTNVSYDHVDILGNSLEEILMQKIGGVKNETLLTTLSNETLIPKMKEYCQNNNVELNIIKEKYNKELGLVGEYQKTNASLALACIKHLKIDLSEEIIEESFKNINWNGRFQKISDNIYLDGAHNLDGVKCSLETATNIFGNKNFNVVSSILAGKDIVQFSKMYKEKAKGVVFTTFDYPRAMKKEELLCYNLDVELDFKKLLNNAFKSNENYLFTGSLYFVTEILKYLENDNYDK